MGSGEQRIAGRYVIESPLGAGRGGKVHAARDLVSGTRVAVKLLDHKSGSSPLDIERAGLRSIEHPNLVRVLDGGIDHGRHYVVTELVEHGSLREMPRPLQPDALGELASQLLEALAFLHAQGILHGDVKTENILVARLAPPRFKLSDFGLAQRQVDVASGTTHGSPAFMPPEIIRGEAPNERSDLYSLGITLYECAFGELPFADDDLKTLLRRHLTERPRRLDSPGTVEPRLVALLRRLLAKEPAERPADARAALKLWQGEEGAVPRWVPAHLGVLIGREAETSQLQLAFASAEIAVASVDGPSGIGKTRLLREFTLLAGLQGVATVWLDSRNLPAAPSEETSATQLAETRARTLLGSLPSTPWILVVDDLDLEPSWFQETIAFALRETAAQPRSERLICVAGGERAASFSREALEVGGLAPPLRISLEPLASEALEKAAMALLGVRRLHPNLLQLLDTVTGRVPSEIEAACQQLATKGLLRIDTAGAIVAAAETTPRSITEPRSARLEQAIAACGQGQKELLLYLALLRHPAPAEFLASFEGVRPEDLAALLRVGLAKKSARALRYECAHESLRRVLLDSLPAAERRQRHDRIAATLDASSTLSDEDPEHHRAQGSSLAAARRALELLSNRVQWLADPEIQRRTLQSVLDLWPASEDGAGRLQIEIKLLDVLLCTGAYDDVLRMAEPSLQAKTSHDARIELAIRMAEAHLARAQAARALIVLDSVGGEDASPRLMALRVRALDIEGRYAEALAASDPLVDRLDPRDPLWGTVLNSRATSLRFLGKTVEAEACLHAAISAAEDLGLTRALAAFLMTLAAVRFYQGHMQDSEKDLLRAYDLLVATGDRFGTVRALNSLAALCAETGRQVEAYERLRSALDLCRRLGETETLSYIHGNLGQLFFQMTRYRDAVANVSEALALARRSGLAGHLAMSKVHQAAIYLALGQRQRAEEVLNESSNSVVPLLYEAQTLVLRCEIGLIWHDETGIQEWVDRASSLFESISAEDELVGLQLVISRYSLMTGQYEEALRLARHARERSLSLALESLHVQASAWLGELLLASDTGEAQATVAAVLSKAKTLGLRESSWQMERVLGWATFLKHDLAGAIQHYAAAIDILREIALDAPTEMMESLLSRPDRVRVFSELKDIRKALT